MASAGMLTALALAGLAGAAVQLQQADLLPHCGPVALGLGLAAVALAAGLRRLAEGGEAAPASQGSAAWRRARRSAGALVPALLVLAMAAVVFAATEFRARARLADRLAQALEGQALQVQGRITGLPQAQAAGWRFQVEVEAAWTADGRPGRLPQRLSLAWNRWPGEPPLPPLRSGERWRWTLKLQRPHALANPGLPDRELALFEQGIGATGSVRPHPPPQRLAPAPGLAFDSLREALREAIFRRLVGAPPRAGELPATAAEALPSRPGEREARVIAALSVGDQAAIERRDWTLYRDTGIAHLMSISGLHVTLFAWLAGGLIRRAWARAGRLPLRLPAPHAAAWGGLLAALAYARLAGWGVPAQRTVLMLAAFTLLRSLGLRWPWPLTLGAVAWLVTLMDPWALLQPGFWLSFGAVAMLMLGEPAGRVADAPAAVAAGFTARGRAALRAAARSLRPAVLGQARITLGLAPLGLLLFQQFAPLGLLANLLAVPLVTLLLMPLSLAGVLLPPLWDLTAWGLGGLHAGLEALQALGRALGPGVWTAPAAPAWAVAAGLFGGLLAVAPLPLRLRVLALPLMLPMLLPAPARLPEGAWQLLAADIGQGSAVLLRTRHHALLYDAGPRFGPDSEAGERVLLPLLRHLGLRRLDALVLSHGDADHIGGAAALIEGLPPGTVHTSLPPDHALAALATRQGWPWRRCEAGQGWQWDGVRFDWLHPDAATLADPAVPSNGRSCVLRVAGAWPESPGGLLQPQRLLLTGDIGRAEELRLARVGDPDAAGPPPALRAEWLMLAHHGSGLSSHDFFLDAVQPRAAFAQAGHRNRHGHPAAALRERLAARGIALIETPHCGAWQLGPDGATCWRAQARRHWQARGAGGSGGSELAAGPPGNEPACHAGCGREDTAARHDGKPVAVGVSSRRGHADHRPISENPRRGPWPSTSRSTTSPITSTTAASTCRRRSCGCARRRTAARRC